MRVLVPRRFIRFGILLAALCLTPVISPSAFALPRPYVDKGDPNPPPPSGDGDGTVVKGASMANATPTATITSGIRVSVGSTVRNYLRLLRMGYGLRWYW
jgi:hypothetical protein